jgi:hypothetical protein
MAVAKIKSPVGAGKFSLHHRAQNGSGEEKNSQPPPGIEP